MTEPSGKIIARPLVARACGHKQEFQHYSIDPYRAQRLAKFQKTRCAVCVAQLEEEQRRARESVPSKADAIRALPVGTELSLARRPDGAWAGKLSAAGR